jgi:oligopeptide transport system ATP-binding protein
LLSVKDLVVRFRVRGRILTAIRGISLDILENESIAIVGESGSGKSVFTKTFAGMLDGNGYIDGGDIIFDDAELADTHVSLNPVNRKLLARAEHSLNASSPLEFGAETWRALQALEQEKADRSSLSAEEAEALDTEISELVFRRTELFNQKQTLDPRKEKDRIREADGTLKALDQKIRSLQEGKKQKIAERKRKAAADRAWQQELQNRRQALEARYHSEISAAATEAQKQRNTVLAKEIVLSVGRYSPARRRRAFSGLLNALKEAMREGKDLSAEAVRNAVFDPVTFRVRYLDEPGRRCTGPASSIWPISRIRRTGPKFAEPGLPRSSRIP